MFMRDSQTKTKSQTYSHGTLYGPPNTWTECGVATTRTTYRVGQKTGATLFYSL